jgi:DNA-binding transcriptional ArsR family regulator
MPICRGVYPSAPSELGWILNLLTQTAPYAVPALAELDHSLLPGISRLRGPIGERFRRLWNDDGVPGCPELMPAAHSAGAVLDPHLRRLFDWLTAGRGKPAHEYELLTEPPHARPAIRDRFRRLCESQEIWHAYRDICADVWQLGSDAWERHGRATVVKACAGWQERIDSGAAIEDLVPPRHPLTRADQLGFEDLFTQRREFAVSPLYFCLSGGHVVDFGDYVHVAVPASDLLPIRRVRDAAYVADRLRILADPTRVHVLIQLMSAPSGVMDVARALRISQPTVSGHLKILREAGLVQPRRHGGRTVYTPSRKRVERLLEDARATLVRWD